MSINIFKEYGLSIIAPFSIVFYLLMITTFLNNNLKYLKWISENITEFINQKIKAIKCFDSQITKVNGPRSIQAVKALAQFRGTQSSFDFGEALYIIRMIA